MSRFGPPGSPNRRRLGVLALGVGVAVVIATVSNDYPREQPIVFRLPDTRGGTLSASFTKVGEAEARTGFTLELGDRAHRDVNHSIRAPNGDYIVTIEFRPAERGDDTSPETSVSERVSLSGSEVVVPVPARASE
jgi:hypothetical protein